MINSTLFILFLYNYSEKKEMSVALPEQLNFERSEPLSGGAKQQMAIALPITGVGSYVFQLGSTFVINIPRC